MKSLNRQHLLLGLLAVIALVRVGDWVLASMIQGPLQERRARTSQLRKDIEKREALLAQARQAGRQIDAWQKQSLPSDVETARSVYRGWVLSLVRKAKLRNATVDSGSPANRSGVYRSLPFSIRVRGTLQQFTEFLYQFSDAPHLHQIASLTLSPLGSTGQFDISIGVETLLLPNTKRDRLNTGSSALLASSRVQDYETVWRNNIFGIGIDHSDPMKHTLVTAITYSNGNAQVWISEQLLDKVTRVGLNESFDTVALSGRIVEVRDQEVVIESSGDRFLLPIGSPFADARLLESSVTASSDAVLK